jgi:hypothetical protein
MTENQILAIALTTIPNVIVILVGILINNARLTDLNRRLDDMHVEMNRRFDSIQSEMNRRFDDMRDTWRSELHRVEEVLDARLKHLEER